MACQVLKIYSDFEAEISDINQLKTGRIVMGTTNHLGTVILPEILLEFKENSPSVELEIWRTIREIWKQNFLPALWILLFSMPRSWLQILY